METESTKNTRTAKKAGINWTDVGLQVGMTALNALIFGGVSAVTARAFSGSGTGGPAVKLAESEGAQVVPFRKVGNA